MTKRKASVKETGDELSPDEWGRFEAAAERARADQRAATKAKGPDARPGPDKLVAKPQ